MLLDAIQESRMLIRSIVRKRNDPDLLKSVPALEESFDNFIHFIREQEIENLSSLKTWSEDLYSIQDGIYKKDKKLISVRTIPKGFFQYLAYYALGRNQISKYIPDLSGKYINILTLCEDQIHYEPEAFSFLIKDEFFETKNPKNIFPCLIIPTLIPKPLEFQWVFIAMRYMNMELSPLIEYKYLATEKEEIQLLKDFDLI